MSKILLALSASIFLVYLCTIAVPVEAFLPPLWVKVRICVYRAESDEDDDYKDMQLAVEKTLLLLHGNTVTFDDIPELKGYFVVEDVDMKEARPTFSINYILEDEMVESRRFYCDSNYSAEASTPAAVCDVGDYFFCGGLWEVKGDEGYKNERDRWLSEKSRKGERGVLNGDIFGDEVWKGGLWKDDVRVHSFSCVNESESQEWRLGEEFLICIFADIYESNSVHQGLILW